MCGTDFVTPFQGLNLFGDHKSQGVALGYHVLRFQRMVRRHANAKLAIVNRKS
jgi:hypothetical protein